MNESNDRIIQEDIEDIVNNLSDNFSDLKNKTIFITGGTGLIGSQIVKTLVCFNRLKQMNMKILVWAMNEEEARRGLSDIMDREDIKIYYGDINDKIEIEEDIDYIIHGASPTNSKFFVSNPVETINIIVNGTINVLEMAKTKNIKGMLFMSSLEVYGVPNKELVEENDYGYIDELNVRSSYSGGKRMAETICASYASEYNIPVKIVRLSQTFGPGVRYNDGRVFAEFARCAIESKDIVLHTEGRTLRTYVYTKDAVSAILFVLLKGEIGEAYNVANKETAMTIKEMAELVCKTFSASNIKVKIEIPEDVAKFGYNPEMIIKLDSTKLEKLGWKPTVNMENMFKNLVASMERDRM